MKIITIIICLLVSLTLITACARTDELEPAIERNSTLTWLQEQVMEAGFTVKWLEEGVDLIWNDYSRDSGVFIIIKEEKYGFINASGEMIIPAIYDYTHGFMDGYAFVEFGDKKLFINIQGEEALDVSEYAEGGAFDGELATVRLDYSHVIIDRFGNRVTEMELDSIGEIVDDLPILVTKDEKSGFIDKAGNIVIPFKYEWANPFSENLAAVRENGKWGYINTKGELVIPIEYDYVTQFYNGRAAVAYYMEGLPYGYVIDRTGQELIGPREYLISIQEDVLIGTFHDGNENMSAIFDSDGNQLTGFDFGGVGGFYEGFGTVIVFEGRQGLYNKYGAEILPTIFDDILVINQNTCLIRVANDDFSLRNYGFLTLPADAATRRPL